MLLRVYLLSGRNQATTVRYVEQLTSDRMSRQALAKQLDAITRATGLRLLDSCRF